MVAYELGKEVGAGGGGGLELLRGGHVLATTEAIVRAAMGNIKADQLDEAGRGGSSRVMRG